MYTDVIRCSRVYDKDDCFVKLSKTIVKLSSVYTCIYMYAFSNWTSCACVDSY